MIKRQLFLFLLTTACFRLSAQHNAPSFKDNAVRIDLQNALSDSIYHLLAPFQVLMLGEMHGTNEPAQLLAALAQMFAAKGDSVQVGFEIPADQMTAFRDQHTPESAFTSDFFAKPAFKDGRGSVAWANAIAALADKKTVDIFFYDITADDSKTEDRDSLMYLKLKKQYLRHPGWKMLTLSGNVHNMSSPQERLGRNTMASYFKQDPELQLGMRICSLNHYYQKGSCRANFGKGLEERPLDRAENDFDWVGFEQYILLVSATSTYPYNGFFYTKLVTAAKMVREE
ncbi:MAG: hypothetical protein WCR52_19635 [Bacteroidota bacterium]